MLTVILILLVKGMKDFNGLIGHIKFYVVRWSIGNTQSCSINGLCVLSTGEVGLLLLAGVVGLTLLP